MSDLISKNELYKKGESLLNSFINGKKNGEQAFRDLFNAIADMPTVEQKHGHWEVSAYCNHKPYRLRHVNKWTIWKCSVCGKNNGRCHSDAYCRHCGAKMDEVTEDE